MPDQKPDRKNFYASLGVPMDASSEEIRSAYFDAARRFHPDANPDPHASDHFISIQEAHEVLSDAARRVAYDKTLTDGDKIAPSVKVNVTYSRQRLPASEEPQLTYALVEIDHDSLSDDDLGPPLNLCLVLDRSTSMNGPRMEMVKANAIQLIRQLKPKDVISVVAFSDKAEVIIPPARVTDVPRLEARIQMISTGGATEIYQGLDAGITQLHEYLSATFSNHMILLTDGRTYGDEEACIELGERAAGEGIGISGIGIGHEWNDVFLDKLTSVSGGSSMYVSAPKDIVKHLQQKFSQLKQVYAEGVSFDFAPKPNVELAYAFRIDPDANPINTKTPLRLGELQRSKSLKFLFEFYIKSTARLDEIVLADGKLTLDVPVLPIPKSRIPLKLSREVGEILEIDFPPESILQSLSRLTYYRMQEKAMREVKTGDIRTATRHLQQLATALLSKGERELAQTVLVEAEHIQQHNKFSQEGDKRIKYGTRALLLPSSSENV